MADFTQAVQNTLESEGLLSNDSNDAGGLTKYGISQKAYPNLDIANLTKEHAVAIYKRDYWDLIKGDEISTQEVAETIFDYGVNAGAITSATLAQRTAGTEPDGKIGSKSIEAINSIDPELFLYKFAAYKIANYINLCNRKPSQREYFFGWVTRSIKHSPIKL